MGSVLVVDDDELIRDMLSDLLSDEHRCHTASTAEKAFELMDEEHYDVVLSDISMPGLSGLELLTRIRQRFPDTPVIIISGINDKEHAQGLIKLGAFDYLLKPFRLEIVEESVGRAIEHHRSLRDNGSGAGS